MTPNYLSGPLRLAMLLAAEGKHEESKAMMERYKRETLERPQKETPNNDDGGSPPA